MANTHGRRRNLRRCYTHCYTDRATLDLRRAPAAADAMHGPRRFAGRRRGRAFSPGPPIRPTQSLNRDVSARYQPPQRRGARLDHSGGDASSVQKPSNTVASWALFKPCLPRLVNTDEKPGRNLFVGEDGT